MQEQVNGRELVARYWQDQMQKHPRVFAILNIIKGCLEFFGAGHVVPWLLYKTLIFSSRVADGVLIAAALWITALNVAPSFMTKLVGGAQSASNFSSMALLAFSLLPELITVAALVITIKHWLAFFKRRERTNVAWIWGTLYTIPTFTFLGMTIYTIGSFVSKDGGLAQITGLALVIRCLAAWGYSFVEILYFELGRQAVIEADERAKLRTKNEGLRKEAEELRRELAQVRTDSHSTAQELAQLRSAHDDMSAQLAQLRTAQHTSKSAQREQEPAREIDGRDDAKPFRKPLEISEKIKARKQRDAKILELYPTLSNRQIAQELDISEATVRNVLAQSGVKRSQESSELSAINS